MGKSVVKGKGSLKRRKAGGLFKKGHKLTPIRMKDASPKQKPRRIIRTNDDLQKFIKKNTDSGLVYNVEENENGEVKVTADLPIEDGEKIDRTMLRAPKVKDVTSSMTDNSGINVIVQRDKMCEMFRIAYQNRAARHKKCHGDLVWDDDNSKRYGLAWKAGIRCRRCKFRLTPYKLYDEVESGTRGPKPAAINMALQTGVMRQGMANHGMREILTAANIASPSPSSMQKTANRVGEIVVEVTQEHLEEVCEKVKEFNQAIGLEQDNPIPVEVDSTYNNPMFRAGDTPFQAGTQATTVCAEKLTGQNLIIGLKTHSKLCSCPKNKPHKPDCTSNLELDSSIGNEGQYLEDIIEQINEKHVIVGDVTMDGDSSARETASRIQQRGGQPVNAKYCTRHLTRNMGKMGHRIPWSERMFHGRTQAQRKKAKGRFVHDLEDRVNAEFEQAHKALLGSTKDMNKELPEIKEAIIDCYRGDHRLCNEHSYVCSEVSQWRRPYINTDEKMKNKEAFLREASRDDLDHLRQMIDIRFSERAVEMTSNNSTQNKCEASMRGIKKPLPNKLTFSRNYSPRAHIATHSMNTGPGTSIETMCQAVGAPIKRNSAVGKIAAAMNKRSLYQKKRKQSNEYKTARCISRAERYALYDKAKNLKEGYNNENVLGELYIPPTRVTRSKNTIAHVEDHLYQCNKIAVLKK